mmetsp:Transcript_66863/g.139337  ORF Transcript_66863/g.139337 Transcript_66863/m.139337 type:complete len:296 (-) Transcript_66863:47-934(-)
MLRIKAAHVRLLTAAASSLRPGTLAPRQSAGRCSTHTYAHAPPPSTCDAALCTLHGIPAEFPADPTPLCSACPCVIPLSSRKVGALAAHWRSIVDNCRRLHGHTVHGHRLHGNPLLHGRRLHRNRRGEHRALRRHRRRLVGARPPEALRGEADGGRDRCRRDRVARHRRSEVVGRHRHAVAERGTRRHAPDVARGGGFLHVVREVVPVDDAPLQLHVLHRHVLRGRGLALRELRQLRQVVRVQPRVHVHIARAHLPLLLARRRRLHSLRSRGRQVHVPHRFLHRVRGAARDRRAA